MNKLPYRSDNKSSLPVIRIESLVDKNPEWFSQVKPARQRNTLMITLSGCYLNEDDVMKEYPSEQAPDMQEAERRVSWLRKQGFEFQLVKVSSTI